MFEEATGMVHGATREMKPIRVLIVDDHPCVIAGLMRLFEGDSHIRVVGTATGLRDAETALVNTSPDVVLLDLKLGDESGFSLVPQARALLPKVKIIVLSTYDEEIYRRHAESLGVQAYVSKSEDARRLRETIYSVAQDTGEDVARSRAGTVLKTLSQAETQVLRHLSDGLSQKEVACEIGVSPSTVATHVQRAKEKLGARSVFQMLSLVGLIDGAAKKN